MKGLYQSMSLLGVVKQVSVGSAHFTLECRSGEMFDVYVSDTTNFTVLQNLDNLNRDRVLDPKYGLDDSSDALRKVKKYVWPDGLIAVQGILYFGGPQNRFEARSVNLFHSDKGKYLFEDTHWWLTQIQIMGNEWLDDLFGDKRTYLLDDFVKLYRTNLNILGLPTDDNIQEMATLSRYIYGLSSAYLLTGSQRYLDAAAAGVKFQRDAFRILSHDGEYCFWAFGRRKLLYGSELIEYSLNPDDYGTIPLYEQIYALAGLAQYFRITGDPEVLHDMRRTVQMFEDFYLDDKAKNVSFPGSGGYFSHIDYVTRRPDHPSLGDNACRKNWNSIGDHIPAYLVNLILTLEPLPLDDPNTADLERFLLTCKDILKRTSQLILKHFPDEESPFVKERFDANWNFDNQWRWQQNRAIVGHNLKIAWNMTRVANYYIASDNEEDLAFAKELMDLTTRLGNSMAEVGLDLFRGGCFDAVERKPGNGMPIEFTWGNTKDFWQQEQGILAYLILHGNVSGDSELKGNYLQLAREMAGFWNLYFLDHDNRGIFFRVTENGNPVVQGIYANKGSHSIAGYHSFELNFLAHIYIRSYVAAGGQYDDNFVLFFKPDKDCHSINVLPDFFPPHYLKIISIKVNGKRRASVDPFNYQITVGGDERGASIAVEFKPQKS